MSGANKKYGLGRGIESLLGGEKFDFEEQSLDDFMENTVFKSEDDTLVEIDKIERCNFQPRTQFDEENLRSLSESIKQNGVLQPILVRKKADKYEIVAGERRWRAAKLAGLKTIPVIVKDLTDSQTLELALIENIQRDNLSAIEEAEGLKKLISEYNYTQDDVAKIIGKSRSYIANTLRLLTLPQAVQELVLQNKLSAGHARALVGMENAVEFAERIVKENLSVREIEKITSKKKIIPRKSLGIEDKDLKIITKKLEEKLHLKVKINTGKKGNGSIKLCYKTPADLGRILDLLEQR